tara:strand:+ start:995 stop:1171 length:177 start_codon:yes stop_codon:yes gene_type:complete
MIVSAKVSAHPINIKIKIWIGLNLRKWVFLNEKLKRRIMAANLAKKFDEISWPITIWF